MEVGKVLRYAALGESLTGAADRALDVSLVVGRKVADAVDSGASTVADAVDATVGKVLVDNEKNKLLEENARLKLKVEKFEKEFKEAIERFQGDKEYFDYIIATTAIGMSMANADGEIAESERQALEEFIGGIVSSNYPEHIKKIIQDLYDNPRNFNTAMKYLENVNLSNYESIRDMLELVMKEDGYIHEKEKAFLKAFESCIGRVEYNVESEDNENQLLLEIKEKITV